MKRSFWLVPGLAVAAACGADEEDPAVVADTLGAAATTTAPATYGDPAAGGTATGTTADTAAIGAGADGGAADTAAAGDAELLPDGGAVRP